MNGADFQALAANGRLVRGADGRLRDAGLQKTTEPGGTQSDHCTTGQPPFTVACAHRMFVRYITEVVDQEAVCQQLSRQKVIVIDTEGANVLISSSFKCLGQHVYLLHNLPITRGLYALLTSITILQVGFGMSTDQLILQRRMKCTAATGSGHAALGDTVHRHRSRLVPGDCFTEVHRPCQTGRQLRRATGLDHTSRQEARE